MSAPKDERCAFVWILPHVERPAFRNRRGQGGEIRQAVQRMCARWATPTTHEVLRVLAQDQEVVADAATVTNPSTPAENQHCREADQIFGFHGFGWLV